MPDKGAHFFRTDLQVHTPRDHSWKGASCTTDDERRAYAEALVEKCRSTSLNAIAITDHHDMLMVEPIRKAAAAEADELGVPVQESERIVVFPGMELTLGVPCQALLIFDADFPEDLFHLAMTALTITPSAPTEPKTAPTERLGHIQSLAQLKVELDKHSYLRDRYIILPNVSDNGQFSLLRKGQMAKYIDMPCVGGYVDGDISKIGTGNRDIIAGKQKAWGNRRIACFQTSDNRRADHSSLGKWTTWIKWATPTAEALRQACLAEESRISHTAPELPAAVIVRLTVTNSAFLGPIDLDFNPQYNVLIGGRGTGKSTILEYLRWGLCDQPIGLVDDELPNYLSRRARLIEQTLKSIGASVEVRFELNRVVHIVRRNSQDGGLTIQVGAEEARSCTEAEIRSLIPIQAFSQKQLSNVSVRLDELTRFLEAPVQRQLSALDQRVDELGARVRHAYSAKRRAISLDRLQSKRQLEGSSLTEQAEALRRSITGLSAEDQQLLADGREFENADRVVQAWRGGVRSVREQLALVRRHVDSALKNLAEPPLRPDAVPLRAAYREYRALLESVAHRISELERDASIVAAEPSVTTDDPWRTWRETMDAFHTKYTEAMARSTVHRKSMEQLKVVEDALRRNAEDSAIAQQELQALSAADAEYEARRADWQAALSQRNAVVAEECERLTATSSGAIRADLHEFGDPRDFADLMRRSLSGLRIQGSKLERLAERITASAKPLETWNGILHDMERLVESEEATRPENQRASLPNLIAVGFTEGEIERIARSLSWEAWLELSLTPPTSSPIFRYRSRPDEYIPFMNASAGQQATALLKTLLNQPGPPLIIDQPEEDLDNPVMLESNKFGKQRRSVNSYLQAIMPIWS